MDTCQIKVEYKIKRERWLKAIGLFRQITKMENKQKVEMERREESKKTEQQPPHYISPMKPLTESAYGGGMYGTEEGQQRSLQKKPASDTQSADGAVEAEMKPKHAPPPSSGDRDIDITGQSYFQ